ncbi:hypothetical protein [Streptomyces milbemycinicus]|uniref:hypothetical protein n=1 Tax=Streptomyces milbemycinicus TaxID=476552 RepID=UPI0021F84993|nr:hypothetical protein [Streptomyces milbemycinicus]
MSSAAALASVDDVVPYLLSEPPPDFSLISEPSTLPNAVPNTVPDTGVPQDVTQNTGLSGHIDTGVGQHFVDAVNSATDHAVDTAMDQVHDMMVPALIGLSSLGGALLVGRAAMAGAQLLSEAVIRAAADQAELEQRQLEACRAAACWKDAAFAAARANARIDSLRARIRRSAVPTGPDGPPGAPDLPPLLDLNGASLEQMWRLLADTDRRLRCAEAAYARATMEAAAGPVSVAHPDGDDGWHAKLRARRQQVLEEYEQAATETETPTAASQPQPTVAAGALTEDEVVRRGAELLATLPHHVSAADYRLVEEQIASAAEVVARRPSKAKLHLRQAAHFAEQKTLDAEQRREHEEWAAQQLAFLRNVPPDIPGPLPDATAEIAILEGVLDKGSTLTDTERRRVEARVGERVGAYERAYAAEVIRAAVEHGEPETITHSTSGTVQVIDWTPPGWGDEHWLRVSVDVHGSAQVATMHRERDPAEETDADRDLDERRCAEASEHLEELRRLAKQAGLSLKFDLGEPPEQAAPPTKTRSARDDRTAPKARDHNDQERRR